MIGFGLDRWLSVAYRYVDTCQDSDLFRLRQDWEDNGDLGEGPGNTELLKAFYLNARIKNLRVKTLQCYAERLAYLLAFAARIGKRLCEVTPSDANRYILELVDSDLSPHTINGRIRVYRAFYNFALREGLVESSPMDKVTLLRTDDTLPDVLSPQQIDMFLSSFNPRNFHGGRNRNMALVLYDAMIRVGELASLRLDSVDLSTGVLKVHGKSRRERMVPISVRTAKSLHSYLLRLRRGIDGDYLFCYQNGDPMTGIQIHHLFSRQGQKLGFKVYPHLLRHSGATQYLRNGGNLVILQHILGHSDIRTTQIYTHIVDNDMKQSHDRFNPVASLRSN